MNQASRVTNVLLVVIAILLAFLAFGPVMTPTLSHGAGRFEYKVSKGAGIVLDERMLNQLGKEGWELVVESPHSASWIFIKR